MPSTINMNINNIQETISNSKTFAKMSSKLNANNHLLETITSQLESVKASAKMHSHRLSESLSSNFSFNRVAGAKILKLSDIESPSFFQTTENSPQPIFNVLVEDFWKNENFRGILRQLASTQTTSAIKRFGFFLPIQQKCKYFYMF